jgi:hypothetical protein
VCERSFALLSHTKKVFKTLHSFYYIIIAATMAFDLGHRHFTAAHAKGDLGPDKNCASVLVIHHF